MKELVKELSKKAVNYNYGCYGKYPCSERDYCRFCGGTNNAHNCDEDCPADEFDEGFIKGWDAAVYYLAKLPFDKMLEYFNEALEDVSMEEVIEENKDVLKRLKDR